MSLSWQAHQEYYYIITMLLLISFFQIKQNKNKKNNIKYNKQKQHNRMEYLHSIVQKRKSSCSDRSLQQHKSVGLSRIHIMHQPCTETEHTQGPVTIE